MKIKHLLRKLIWITVYILPIKKNRVFICSYTGGGYSCNPKAVAEELIKNSNYEVVWIVNHKSQNFPKQVKQIKYTEFNRIIYMGTAKFWISNVRLDYFIKKKKQYYVQLWHGDVPLKKIEADAEDKLPIGYLTIAKRDSRFIDVMVSNNSFKTDLYKRSFWYKGEVLNVGTPRNDILYRNDKTFKSEIRKQLSIEEKVKIVLYAPTFRNNYKLDVYNVDFQELINNLSQTLGGKWMVLCRLHPNFKKYNLRFYENSANVKDVTYYPDCQDLISISDLLITDYSGLMFTFLAIKKPCILYAPDIESYEEERGFYFDLQMLPFPIARDNKELDNIVKDFSIEDYMSKTLIFRNKFNFIENKESSKCIVDWMNRKMEEK